MDPSRLGYSLTLGIQRIVRLSDANRLVQGRTRGCRVRLKLEIATTSLIVSLPVVELTNGNGGQSEFVGLVGLPSFAGNAL